MKYTLDYFIDKLSKIPTNLWVGSCGLSSGNDNIPEKTCAMGFCGGWTDYSEESAALANILKKWYLLNGIKVSDYSLSSIIWKLNDTNQYINLDTPKERIMFALNFIKQHEDALKVKKEEVKERIVYVVVDPVIKEIYETSLS